MKREVTVYHKQAPRSWEHEAWDIGQRFVERVIAVLAALAIARALLFI